MSRIAMSGSTATCQAHRTSRSWRRACPAAAGSLTSRRRRWCSSTGRAGAIAFIGSSADVLDAIPPKMVLQFALQYIGQLTDLNHSEGPPRLTPGHNQHKYGYGGI